jgi:hypothetical protein
MRFSAMGLGSLILNCSCLTFPPSIMETYDHVRDRDPILEVPNIDP